MSQHLLIISKQSILIICLTQFKLFAFICLFMAFNLKIISLRFVTYNDLIATPV